MHPPTSPAAVAARKRQRNHRLVRQLHLWIGAWGAVAAIIYGLALRLRWKKERQA